MISIGAVLARCRRTPRQPIVPKFILNAASHLSADIRNYDRKQYIMIELGLGEYAVTIIGPTKTYGYEWSNSPSSRYLITDVMRGGADRIRGTSENDLTWFSIGWIRIATLSSRCLHTPERFNSWDATDHRYQELSNFISRIAPEIRCTIQNRPEVHIELRIDNCDYKVVHIEGRVILIDEDSGFVMEGSTARQVAAEIVGAVFRLSVHPEE